MVEPTGLNALWHLMIYLFLTLLRWKAMSCGPLRIEGAWLEHPDWSRRELAQAVEYSKSWVKKWLKRIRGSPLEDRQVLNGRSRAWKRPPVQVAPEVVNRILEIRDHPPQKLGRTPGPLTILYYLKQDKNLTEAGIVLPRSTRTNWKILDWYHRILRAEPHHYEMEERPESGGEWGMDFDDVSSVPADAEGKQHVVEILSLVDHGSSSVVVCKPAKDYTAETVLRAVAHLPCPALPGSVLVEQDCPDRIRLDRDPPWVGSWTAKDFLSCVFFSVWELSRRFARLRDQTRISSLNAITEISSMNASCSIRRMTWLARWTFIFPPTIEGVKLNALMASKSK